MMCVCNVTPLVCVCVQEVLVEQRTALSDMLQQLLKQRDQREQELRQVLVRNYLVAVLFFFFS